MYLRALERIGSMMHLPPIESITGIGIEIVALRQEVLQRAYLRRKHRTVNRVADFAVRGNRIRPKSLCRILYGNLLGRALSLLYLWRGVPALLQTHPRIVIGQSPCRPCNAHGNRICSVQTEKPDTGVAAFSMHIGSDIRLVKIGERREGRRPDRAHSRHG